MTILRYFVNSAMFTAAILFGQALLIPAMAYALSRFRFRGRDALFFVVIMLMLLPFQVTMAPSVTVLRWLGIMETPWAVILPMCFSPFYIFLLRQFMVGIPNELLEAGAIDGAGNFRIFRQIVFPMAKNSTVTVVIYNFVSIWNEFTYANTFMTKDEMKTLPIGLNAFVGEMGRRDWGATFSAIVIAILPTIIVYFFLNKQVMEGMAAGAVKS